MFFHLYKAGLGRFFFNDFIYGTIDSITKSFLIKEKKNLLIKLPPNMTLINFRQNYKNISSDTIRLKPSQLDSFKYFIFCPRQNLVLKTSLSSKINLNMYCQTKKNSRIIFEIKTIFEFIYSRMPSKFKNESRSTISVIFDKHQLDLSSQFSNNIFFFNYELLENNILNNFLFFSTKTENSIELNLKYQNNQTSLEIYIFLATLVYLIFRVICQVLQIENAKNMFEIMGKVFKNSPISTAFKNHVPSKCFNKIHEILKKLNRIQFNDRQFYYKWMNKIFDFFSKHKIKNKGNDFILIIY